MYRSIIGVVFNIVRALVNLIYLVQHGLQFFHSAKMAFLNPCMKFKTFFDQKTLFEALWKCHLQKIFITFSRVRQIQDLGQSKYKLRLPQKGLTGFFRYVNIGWSLEIPHFLTVLLSTPFNKLPWISLFRCPDCADKKFLFHTNFAPNSIHRQKHQANRKWPHQNIINNCVLPGEKKFCQLVIPNCNCSI